MAHPIRFRRWLTLSIALLITILVTLSTAGPAHADTTVENCSDDSAFNSALIGGGVVIFNCGDNHNVATIVLSSTKTISNNTTIDGGGKVTLSGNHSLRLFTVNTGVTLTLQNIVLTSGYDSSSNGGTIYNAGHLVLNNITIRDAGNSNFYGGGIATISTVDVTNSQFINDKGGSGGAIYAAGSPAVVTISGSTFSGNSVTSTNPNSQRGGALYVTNGATINLSTSLVDSNTGAYGSGIANEGANLTLTDVTLSNNESTGSGNGGGIYNTGTTTLTRVTFDQNSIRYGDGGGMYNKGTATLTDVYFSLNDASYGGGIANDHGMLDLTGGLFTKNSANVAGGGGAANEFGTMNLTDATFSTNFATGDAGGVENGKGTTTLTNVTLVNNNASDGGGMWNLYGGDASLTNVTISGNSADTAGGIGNTNDPNTHLYLSNVVVANSTQGDNCVFQKAPDFSDSNLSSDNTCSFGSGRDGVTIKLAAPETNGGALVGNEQTPLLTMRPLRGSLVIDHGDTVAVPDDERGDTRPRGSSFDVGAVEFVPCSGAPTPPERIAPLQKAIVTTSQALLDWAGPDCAKTFNVIVRQKSKTGPVVFSKTKLKTSQVQTPALANNQTYVWQVTACVKTTCTASGWFKFKRQ